MRYKIASAIIAALLGFLLASPADATAPTRDPAKVYHCGPYFHGHTVRGYLLDIKWGIPTHIAYVPPPETLLLWVRRGFHPIPCQR